MVVAPSETITDFYAGKCVFITGGTGFLGMVLIEKLLYSCPEIDKIYMLIREKKGLTVDQRINEYFKNPLFNRLKNEQPQNLKKLVPISGEVNVSNLGISRDDEDMLIETVSIVIHSAATVKFNEPLKVAWNINVEGTKMVLELAQRMKRVEVFIHISTAYSNTNRKVIEEVLYPAPATMDEMLNLLKQDLSEADTRRIIGESPNTYVFTKAITEHLVAGNQTYMPTIIIRPSVICAIKDDPIKGWLTNWFGATGLLVPIAKGLNRVMYGGGNNILDLIPVDYVSNLVIAAGAKHSRSNNLQIYNSCSSDCNAITYKEVLKGLSDDIIEHKSYAMPLPRWYVFTKYFWLASIVTILFQLIPACLADIFRYFMGKKPMFVKLNSRLVTTRNAVRFFTERTWIIRSDRTQELFSSLPPSDKDIFPCDAAKIEWDKYIRDYSSGVRRFLEKKKQKETDQTENIVCMSQSDI